MQFDDAERPQRMRGDICRLLGCGAFDGVPHHLRGLVIKLLPSSVIPHWTKQRRLSRCSPARAIGCMTNYWRSCSSRSQDDSRASGWDSICEDSKWHRIDSTSSNLSLVKSCMTKVRRHVSHCSHKLAKEAHHDSSVSHACGCWKA